MVNGGDDPFSLVHAGRGFSGDGDKHQGGSDDLHLRLGGTDPDRITYRVLGYLHLTTPTATGPRGRWVELPRLTPTTTRTS